MNQVGRTGREMREDGNLESLVGLASGTELLVAHTKLREVRPEGKGAASVAGTGTHTEQARWAPEDGMMEDDKDRAWTTRLPAMS